MTTKKKMTTIREYLRNPKTPPTCSTLDLAWPGLARGRARISSEHLGTACGSAACGRDGDGDLTSASEFQVQQEATCRC